MNDSAPRPSRDPLSSTLQSWHHQPTPSPEFNASVWSRIRASKTSAPAPSSASVLARIFSFRESSAFPLAASLAVIVSLAAGAGGAIAFNHTVTTHRMATAYVRTIDPIQMTATGGAHAPHVHP